MPLTEANKRLLPDKFYLQYLACLENLCRAKNVSLINLADEHFSESDFYDTAHLNNRGGQALISRLSVAIASIEVRPAK